VDINEESTSMKNVPVVSDLNVPKGVCPVRKERIENERKKNVNGLKEVSTRECNGPKYTFLGS
jgi:hypothetical protein